MADGSPLKLMYLNPVGTKQPGPLNSLNSLRRLPTHGGRAKLT